MNRYVEAVRAEALRICDEMNLELFSVEEVFDGGMKIIQVLVDSFDQSELTIDDITKVIEILQEIVEKHDLIPDEYYLEVSSVGIERPLRNLAEIEKATGEYIYLEFNSPVEKSSSWYGILEKVENNNIVLKVNQKGKIKKLVIPYENISFARKAVKF